MAEKLLDGIASPADIRGFNAETLEELAVEIRERIIDTVAATGGHLAPSLGVVELTLALHREFNTPEDKLVWDVGHQAYAHKLITGRRKDFSTIRQYRGLSGFPKRDESEYDTFGVGHAGTSLSAAYGMALARDAARRNHKVIAVIGDGSMTSGMAFEALNHAGHDKRDFTIILNDNRMSISRNVGAMSSYLTKIITDPTYNRLKDDVWNLTGKLSGVGDRLRRLVHQVETATKRLMVPGGLFEDLGFRYLGPIDGHNLHELLPTLRAVRKMNGPVLVHVITTKGKGYVHAEENAERFHGIGGFEKQTGTSASKKDAPPSYSTVFGKTMVAMGKKDQSLFGITAAMADGTGLKYFQEAFPERFVDVGIAEQHAVTLAAGMAAGGIRPVVAVYSSFLQRSYDQIIHDVALQNLPVIFVLDRAGLVGEDGPTHHGTFDLSYLRQIPNMAVMAPKDEVELERMLWTALAHRDGPVAIRFPRGTGPREKAPGTEPDIAIGRGETVCTGSTGTMLAVGRMVQTAWQAARMLERDGIDAGVENMRFVKPLDGERLRRILTGGAPVMCLEDNTVRGGFGSAVLEWAQANGFGDRVIDLAGLPDSFVEHGSMDQLFAQLQLDPPGIADRFKRLIKG